MKLLAGLLISVSLVLGTIAGATAYLPHVSSITPGDALLLVAPAGVKPDGSGEPLLDPSEAPILLDAETLALLKEAGVERVRVKAFSFSRWSHRYVFLLACAGLGLGAWLVRRQARLEVARTTVDGATASPEQLLSDALQKVQRLRGEVAELSGAEARKRIVQVLDELGRVELDSFVQARSVLVGRFGMAGYAQVMDLFSAAERRLNRAWSAAADHVMDEAGDCLAEGEQGLEQTLKRLAAS